METTCVFAAGEFFCDRCLSILALDKLLSPGPRNAWSKRRRCLATDMLYLLLTFRVIEHSTALCHFIDSL